MFAIVTVQCTEQHRPFAVSVTGGFRDFDEAFNYLAPTQSPFRADMTRAFWLNDNFVTIVEVDHVFEEEQSPAERGLPVGNTLQNDPAVACPICGVVGTRGAWCKQTNCPKAPI